MAPCGSPVFLSFKRITSTTFPKSLNSSRTCQHKKLNPSTVEQGQVSRAGTVLKDDVSELLHLTRLTTHSFK